MLPDLSGSQMQPADYQHALLPPSTPPPSSHMQKLLPQPLSAEAETRSRIEREERETAAVRQRIEMEERIRAEVRAKIEAEERAERGA